MDFRAARAISTNAQMYYAFARNTERLPQMLTAKHRYTDAAPCIGYLCTAPNRIWNGVSGAKRIVCPRATTWLNTDQAAP